MFYTLISPLQFVVKENFFSTPCWKDLYSTLCLMGEGKDIALGYLKIVHYLLAIQKMLIYFSSLKLKRILFVFSSCFSFEIQLPKIANFNEI